MQKILGHTNIKDPEDRIFEIHTFEFDPIIIGNRTNSRGLNTMASSMNGRRAVQRVLAVLGLLLVARVTAFSSAGMYVGLEALSPL